MAREKVLKLQGLEALSVHIDSVSSTVSVFCKNESTVSYAWCVK